MPLTQHDEKVLIDLQTSTESLIRKIGRAMGLSDETLDDRFSENKQSYDFLQTELTDAPTLTALVKEALVLMEHYKKTQHHEDVAIRKKAFSDLNDRVMKHPKIVGFFSTQKPQDEVKPSYLEDEEDAPPISRPLNPEYSVLVKVTQERIKTTASKIQQDLPTSHPAKKIRTLKDLATERKLLKQLKLHYHPDRPTGNAEVFNIVQTLSEALQTISSCAKSSENETLYYMDERTLLNLYNDVEQASKKYEPPTNPKPPTHASENRPARQQAQREKKRQYDSILPVKVPTVRARRDGNQVYFKLVLPDGRRTTEIQITSGMHGDNDLLQILADKVKKGRSQRGYYSFTLKQIVSATYTAQNDHFLRADNAIIAIADLMLFYNGNSKSSHTLSMLPTTSARIYSGLATVLNIRGHNQSLLRFAWYATQADQVEDALTLVDEFITTNPNLNLDNFTSLPEDIGCLLEELTELSPQDSVKVALKLASAYPDHKFSSEKLVPERPASMRSQAPCFVVQRLITSNHPEALSALLKPELINNQTADDIVVYFANNPGTFSENIAMIKALPNSERKTLAKAFCRHPKLFQHAEQWAILLDKAPLNIATCITQELNEIRSVAAFKLSKKLIDAYRDEHTYFIVQNFIANANSYLINMRPFDAKAAAQIYKMCEQYNTWAKTQASKNATTYEYAIHAQAAFTILSTNYNKLQAKHMPEQKKKRHSTSNKPKRNLTSNKSHNSSKPSSNQASQMEYKKSPSQFRPQSIKHPQLIIRREGRDLYFCIKTPNGRDDIAEHPLDEKLTYSIDFFDHLKSKIDQSISKQKTYTFDLAETIDAYQNKKHKLSSITKPPLTSLIALIKLYTTYTLKTEMVGKLYELNTWSDHIGIKKTAKTDTYACRYSCNNQSAGPGGTALRSICQRQ